METWKSQGRDANTPRGQDVGDDSDASVDSDGVKRKRFKIDPSDMKGGTMQIKDMKTLLQYFEPDPDYGTQPVERHLMPIDDWLHRPGTAKISRPISRIPKPADGASYGRGLRGSRKKNILGRSGRRLPRSMRSSMRSIDC